MAACTAVRASGLTAVEPLTTRDTVDRDTPAAAATSSMVARDDTALPSAAAPARLQRPCGDDPSVLATAVLHGALLSVVVDAHDSEALVVPPGPLEVVHQRPVEEAPHVDSRLGGIQ